jgi:hypothetical protein
MTDDDTTRLVDAIYGAMERATDALSLRIGEIASDTSTLAEAFDFESFAEFLADARREQTAATILAGLIQAHAIANRDNPKACSEIPAEYRDSAVLMADALRAALDKVKP